MPETEKERILRLIAEGVLTPEEGARMIEALQRVQQAQPTTSSTPEPPKEKPKTNDRQNFQKVEIPRPDGTHETIEVPPALVPAVMKVIGAYMKESAKSAAKDAWGGFKVVASRSLNDMKSNLRSRISGSPHTDSSPKTPSPEEIQRREERRRLLQMVESGRLKAEEAERIFEQLDALHQEKRNVPSGQTH
ncbi:MAG TPA: hypothetical protein VKV29_02805 [Chthonomonas sp.]|jgi:polyhydroxyalkanoate synthesis regulator phasin|uniref:SHOCT-like domain-containing protein n=1 Tax=Chthonomonas sp. TaxID=2282153 RepID=UPI002B4B05C3|nr:hypothetical protein [Chthonomonas sp.]HLH79194.1 hypothetical protein [Chthonomonas sp.]